MLKTENPEEISIVDLLNDEWAGEERRKKATKKSSPSMKGLRSRRKSDKKKRVYLFTLSIAVITTVLLQLTH